jgi:hypothetical protein
MKCALLNERIFLRHEELKATLIVLERCVGQDEENVLRLVHELQNVLRDVAAGLEVPLVDAQTQAMVLLQGRQDLQQHTTHTHP